MVISMDFTTRRVVTAKHGILIRHLWDLDIMATDIQQVSKVVLRESALPQKSNALCMQPYGLASLYVNSQNIFTSGVLSMRNDEVFAR